ncbi:MAG: 16S rRNA (guanine(527)-N(7))-methyltransferase RsmG [Halanaerobiaceae bacterium]
MDRKLFDDLMGNGIKKLGLEKKDKLFDDLWIYMNFLIEENNKYNLTAIDREEEIIGKHFLDSLVFFQKYNIKEHSRIIDIGTGAGFPGLVLKIYRPDLEILLLDSLKKRIGFLNELINKLSLNKIQAVHARAEELGNEKNYREKYDMSVSRAVASINILCEYTIPFVKIGGKAVYFKGPDYEKEIEEAEKAAKTLGGKITNTYQVNIPGIEGERYLVNIDKIKKTPSKYPRRPGMPKKRPL